MRPFFFLSWNLTVGCASDESWPAPFKGSPGGASPFAAAACSKSKFSRYNQKVELSGKLFLYNALTGGYASVDEEYRDNFDKCDFKKLDSMKELAELPNAIINQLMEGGFIIPKNFDEFNVIKSMHYRGRFGANKALTMTLIPTMNCNFRCPYCYEKDKKYPVKKMTTEVMDYSSCKKGGWECVNNSV